MCGVAAGAVAARGGAAGRTWVVDGDGRGTARNCDASAPAFKTVQGAVKASHAGDTIVVCPGTYVGRVVIPKTKDRLVLRATQHLAATLKVGPASGQASIIRIAEGADRVTIQDLALRYPTAAPPAPGGEDCGILMGIQVDGRHARIVGNSVVATGAGTLSCGIAYGIGVGYAGDAASASLRFNVVRDTMIVGIAAGGPGVRLDAFRNIVRYYHDKAAAHATPTTARRWAGARAIRWSEPALRGLRPAGIGEGAGIAVFSGAAATVRENTVEGARTGRGPQSSGLRLFLTSGITTADIGGSTTIAGNRVYRAAVDIGTGPDAITGAGAVPSSTAISDNLVLSGLVGILAGGSGATIAGNEAHGNSVGLLATVDSSGNTFDGNDARSNLAIDCVDDTSPLANTWTDNLAFSSQPTSICLEP
jgi:parallel beta-helix repeat protein